MKRKLIAGSRKRFIAGLIVGLCALVFIWQQWLTGHLDTTRLLIAAPILGIASRLFFSAVPVPRRRGKR